MSSVGFDKRTILRFHHHGLLQNSFTTLKCPPALQFWAVGVLPVHSSPHCLRRWPGTTSPRQQGAVRARYTCRAGPATKVFAPRRCSCPRKTSISCFSSPPATPPSTFSRQLPLGHRLAESLPPSSFLLYLRFHI